MAKALTDEEKQDLKVIAKVLKRQPEIPWEQPHAPHPPGMRDAYAIVRNDIAILGNEISLSDILRVASSDTHPDDILVIRRLSGLTIAKASKQLNPYFKNIKDIYLRDLSYYEKHIDEYEQASEEFALWLEDLLGIWPSICRSVHLLTPNRLAKLEPKHYSPNGNSYSDDSIYDLCHVLHYILGLSIDVLPEFDYDDEYDSETWTPLRQRYAGRLGI